MAEPTITFEPDPQELQTLLEGVGLEPVALRRGERLATPGAELARFEDQGVIGEGGMGLVHRVLDRSLNRSMAMKILKAPLAIDPRIAARFLEEAQITAQLEHPGIVPVHELGQLHDGRYYFTMKEVQGHTLRDVLRDRRRAWTFRRLVDAFWRVCDAVAHAHGRGVVHRDLKPANVLIDDGGSVLVVDWGIAKVIGRFAPITVVSAHTTAGPRFEGVTGTPAYMSPEQARGDVDAVDLRSDVYSLGMILYEILWERRAYTGSDARDVLDKVLAGPPEQPGGGPEPLVEIYQRASARAPSARYPSARALADALLAWLDGVRQRERAWEMVDRGRALTPRVAALRSQAAERRASSDAALAGVPAWAGEAAKAGGWRLAAEAAALEREAALVEVEQEQLLQGALAHAELPAAHLDLARLHQARHAAAEAVHDRFADQHAARLAAHVKALPVAMPERAALAAWLEGLGALTVTSLPPGVSVTARRYEERNRRLVPAAPLDLGETPLRERSLPRGSYQLALSAPGLEPVRVPVVIERGQTATLEGVRLPLVGALDAGDCYVPAGPFRAGGDPSAIGSLPAATIEVGGFVMRRFPVTNTGYIRFLDDLAGRGREDEALAHAPRERGGTAGEPGRVIYGYASGRFSLKPDADGDLWEADWPVLMVSWAGASAYAAWEAERSGLPWRLPTSAEWEKAARGVDGRFHPWGDELDPSWCCMRDSHPGAQLPAVVDSFPVDESPYGVRGLGGNARDWCADRAGDGRYINRGGFWLGNAREARSADLHFHPASHRAAEISFRLVRSLA